jgi:phosphoribosylaminoimidazole-succinocarboxamide synthase
MTSVKEFRVTAEPTATDLGRGRFVFTDDYSVFDWGKMPDRLPGKGASLCTMGAYNFELLEDAGVPTHYRGVVVGPDAGATDAVGAEDLTDDVAADEVVPLHEAETAPRQMAISLTQVPDLPFRGEGEGYDYAAYHDGAGENFLVPLEVVFRNTVPVGSSLRKRVDPTDVGVDAEEWPDEAIDLPEPVVEFSTKYEEQDRYLDRAEAARIAGTADLDSLETLAREVNEVVTARAGEAGFVHEDGKIEVLYHDGELKVADVVGTFDENRFSYGGQEVSKEVVRQWYKREQPQWVSAVASAKDAAADRGLADWRSLCSVQPRTLPDDVKRAAAAMYQAGTNAYTGEQWFDAPGMDAAVDAVRDL